MININNKCMHKQEYCKYLKIILSKIKSRITIIEQITTHINSKFINNRSYQALTHAIILTSYYILIR